MKLGESLKYTGSTTNVSENTGLKQSGNYSPTSSTIFHFLQSYKTKSFLFMEDFLLQSKTYRKLEI